MMDIRLISAKGDKKEEQSEERYWMDRLFHERILPVGKEEFPLEVAVFLFNRDYADLRVCGSGMLIEIMPAGLAVLQSRRATAEPERSGTLHFAP